MFVAGLKDTTKLLHISNLSKHVVFKGENAGGFSLSVFLLLSYTICCSADICKTVLWTLYTIL